MQVNESYHLVLRRLVEGMLDVPATSASDLSIMIVVCRIDSIHKYISSYLYMISSSSPLGEV